MDLTATNVASVYMFLYVCFYTISIGLSGASRDVVGVQKQYYADARHIADQNGLNNTFDIIDLPFINASLSQYDQIQLYVSYIDTNNIIAVVAEKITSLQIATEKQGIPYFVTSLHTSSNLQSENLLYILPEPCDIAIMTLDFMKKYEWRNVAIIYDETLNKNSIELLVSDLAVHVRLWEIKSPTHDIQDIIALDETIKGILTEVRDQEISHLVSLTKERTTVFFVTYAQMMGVLASPNRWLILDMGNSELTRNTTDNLKTNITSMILMSPEPGLQPPIASDWGYPVNNYSMADSFFVIKNIISDKYNGDNRSLIERAKSGNFIGHSGNIQFSPDGTRDNHTFYLRQSGDWNYTLIGQWKSDPEVEDERLELYPLNLKQTQRFFTLRGKSVKVVTIMEKPFTMYKKDYKSRRGNDRFEGFAVDVIKHVSERLQFNYELYIVHDGQFGRKMENGEWNGIMGEVISGNATMCVAPLSINSDRETAIDFTKPFKTRAINVLMKTPEVQSWYFQFLSPLSTGVWLAILISLFVVGFILYVLERFSKISGHHTDRFDPGESLWFVFGSLVQGGTEVPVTLPGRVLAAAWWFFAMILISSYTANLAAFLTVQQIYPPISQVTELADQNKIKYGTVVNSGVASFFNRTQIVPFAKMWTQMSEIIPGALVANTTEGLKKVKEGNYAFLWDNTVTSYMASIDCEFTQIGPSFDTKGFGIGVASGSVYLDDLSMTILNLEDHGIISKIEDKWWGITDSCELDSENSGDTTELHITHVAGIFFVLIGGVFLAIVCCVIEIGYWRCRPKLMPRTTPQATVNLKTPNNGVSQL